MPSRWHVSSRRRSNARGHRTRSPFDESMVERLLAGDMQVQPTYADLHEAILRMCDSKNGKQIARRLGVTDRTVYRHLAAERAAVDFSVGG